MAEESNKLHALSTTTTTTTATTTATTTTCLVSISYLDLVSVFDSDDTNNVRTTHNNSISKIIGSLLSKIHEAYASADSLGILVLRDMPLEYVALRKKALPLAQKLVTKLSQVELDELTVPEADYQVGWSYGKEQLDKNRVDTAKGSFYFNPLTENFLQEIQSREEQVRIVGWDNKCYVAPNVWPSLDGFEHSMKEMGKMVHTVGLAIAKLCDLYVSQQCPGYAQNKISSILSKSLYCKARLLHYFAIDNSDFKDASSNENNNGQNYSTWCGWHNDHGSLTGLVPGMYLDHHGNILPSCPDPDAGLYIKSRNGIVHHVDIPSDCLAFQIGETTQIHSGGILQATPHAVRGGSTNIRGVTRESFALFMEPEYSELVDLPTGRTIDDLQTANAEKNLPDTVQALKSRYQLGANFEGFSNATLAAFY